MSQFHELEPGIFVSGQLSEADFAAVCRHGIRTIVNNRPEEETAGQISTDALRDMAHRRSVGFHSQPVWNFDVTDSDAVRRFERTLIELPKPILFYCRSGRRSTILWAQAALARLGLEQVLGAAERAGQQRDAVQAILSEAPVAV